MYKVDQLIAIHWLLAALTKLSPTTIKNYFKYTWLFKHASKVAKIDNGEEIF